MPISIACGTTIPTASNRGKLLLDESSRERFIELTRTKEPKLVFGAHLANWELLLWCCGAYEGEAGIVYRPTNVGPLDRKLLEIRLRSGVSLIAGNAEAFFTAKRMLHGAGVIGMLVDEHFPRGVPVTFFGRECTVNPLLARYARQFDCAIHGGRIVRLPRGKFRLDITDSIVGPRDGSGRLDVAGTMQLVTNVIEGWIREHPEQWLWIQRRWRL